MFFFFFKLNLELM